MGVEATRETVPKKIREAQLMKIPYTLVVGDKEIESGTVAVRDREGHEVRGVPFESFAEAAAKTVMVFCWPAAKSAPRIAEKARALATLASLAKPRIPPCKAEITNET